MLLLFFKCLSLRDTQKSGTKHMLYAQRESCVRKEWSNLKFSHFFTWGNVFLIKYFKSKCTIEKSGTFWQKQMQLQQSLQPEEQCIITQISGKREVWCSSKSCSIYSEFLDSQLVHNCEYEEEPEALGHLVTLFEDQCFLI